jgi:hypothetical protein
MNLEQNILPGEINTNEWVWMKNYRVWEANRRIFLYPENWIEPELRDNKTPFFKELESELLQNEINNDNVEKVFMNYLEKLDDVAKLDICGLYEDTEAMEVHVFGRTLNMPSVYYYRKLNQQTNIWTAWEKVPLDIQGKEDGDDTGVHLLPVVWNRRLHLFWPVFTIKNDPNKTPAEDNFINSSQKEVVDAVGLDRKNMWEIKIAWSEYRGNKWVPKKITRGAIYSKSISIPKVPNILEILVGQGFYCPIYLPKQSEHFLTLNNSTSNLSININRNYDVVVDAGTFFPEAPPRINHFKFKSFETIGAFEFTGCHNKVSVITNPDPKTILPQPLSPPGTISFYQEFASTQQIATKLELTDIPKTTVPLLGLSQGIYQLLKSNIISRTGYYNFFFEDKLRTYYVTPEGFMRLRSDFREVEKTDFKKLTTATTLIKEKFVAEKLLVNLQPANGGVVQPEVLKQNGIAINTVINSPDLSKSSLQVKIKIDQPYVPYLSYSETKFTFHPHYHPYVCNFMQALNKGGIKELLTISNQYYADKVIRPIPFPIQNGFQVKYLPNLNNVSRPLPVTHVEFEQGAAYETYNWELFFHIPMLIANRLSKNQRFEEANRWYQFVFNPTTNIPVITGNDSTRYWNLIPFTQTPKETIQELMNKLQSTNSAERSEIETAIEAWRNNPFNPHLVARMRLIAYQKNTVMKYLDNLIAWGDQLFSRDTIESINEATQLYIMAAEILGRYPQKIPAKGLVEPKSFSELKGTLDAFSNAMVKMETIFPFFTMAAVNNFGGLPATATSFVSTLYFCIPDNDKLLSYWDLVADRLFKIRHCQNIDGVERQLALFEPRIDPALLVRAVANGIDINSLLNEINAPLPHYRFSYMIEKALQMCSYLTSIGASYLSALEKQDAEELSMLKATQETTMQSLIKEIKQSQILEATRNREGLEKTRDVTQTRFDYYTGLVTTGLIESEKENLNKLGLAKARQDEAALIEITANMFHLVFPDISVSVSIPGPGGSVGTSYGGSNIASALTEWGRYINFLAASHTYEANSSSINSVNIRRADDWAHQQKLAAKELQQIDKQILASQVREDISTKDLNNQEQQIENAQLTEEFLRNKFTNQELLGWMIGEMATCFFPYYQLVYAWAKAAERCYRFELGIPNTNFISFGYWDSFRKGLMAGEKLQLALKQMEQSYIECNKREYELTKHISLLQINPLALLALKETGSCIIELPESLFDMDYPGQFMRKIKSVSISIPCVVGPYTSINCTLTLLKSKVRMKNILRAGAYTEQEEDDRFETRLSATNAIATSHAQNDPGMFELNFRDERFLPFEGAGAISSWKINMPIENNQFNIDTVSDLILHLKYTAQEGGKILADAAMKEIKDNNKTGNRLFSLKHEFPNEWYAFLNPAAPNTDQVLSIKLDGDRFPYQVSSGNFTITNIAVLVDSAAASIPVLSVTSPGNTSKPYTFSKVPVKYGPLFTGHPSSDWAGELPGIWKLINPSTNAIKITKDNCNDILLVVSYEKT